MTLISGKQGRVLSDDTMLADITEWSFQTTSHKVSYASSATGGYRRQLPGSKVAQGHFSFVINTSDPVSDQLNEGDVVELKLHVDNDHLYTVPAIIDSVRLDVDVSEGPPVRGRAEFSSDGAWTVPTYS